ncbi:hypothetical protein [Actinophytocola gossypii]|uniref:tRNA-guanine(15) transglycosylase-like domain-containing protein n=1 Tax=Actinophytocola gossypii TaxID=2812003 RepID=A0ABT2J3G5_9PSEU|nr:hypothetical protein [Actinophytocola gossypii]MCT2582397.1 hypothetical protein [Actinophytocola gossypii]
MVGARLDELNGRLLIQCQPGQAKNAARVAAAHDTGLVLTGHTPGPVVRALREHGFTGPILCDAARYAGRRRAFAESGPGWSWTAEQHDLGLLALTDSGYLAEHDWPGLRRILAGAARQPGQVLPVLPLAARWFEHSVDGLVAELNRASLPVAVAIEHQKDPFSVRYLIRGFLSLLAAEVPVVLLRADVSAVAALAHGTHAAAIGTTTALRHVYPRTGRLPVPRLPSISAFVPQLLDYRPLPTIAARTAPSWHCDCPECDGRPLTTLARSARPEASAFRHSLSAQLTLHDHLRDHPAPVVGWHDLCASALAEHRALAESLPDWHTPTNLRAWHQLTRLPAAVRNPPRPAASS